MPDDHGKMEERFLKSLDSHNGLIPSEDFSIDDFALWMEYASPNELENDVLSAKTYHRMQEVSLEPDCEPKIEFDYFGSLKLKVEK
jgi:hypothetical protein